MTAPTEQEVFWASEFGNDYIDRNKSATLEASNTIAFAQMLRKTHDVHSILELGANVGMNMRAIRHIMPAVSLSGVEINKNAHDQLATLPGVNAHHDSIADFTSAKGFDLVFTKGVLIHINPDQLPDVYRNMIKLSNKWILLCEYYNPSPQQITYRGHSNKLFKRDFCGELMAIDSSLKLVDYGFFYHRDAIAPQDDLTWFLLEKK
jgi:pseudaminic acid biosynthesis-associated methylase